MRSSTVVAMVALALLALGGWAVAQVPAPAAAPAPQQPPAAAAPPAAPATATVPVIYVEAMRIQLDGKTQYAGNVQMEFKPQGRDTKLVSVDVIPKMKSDEIARDLYKQLTLATGTDFKVKQSGDRITIERSNKKGPTFSLKITNQSVLGVSFLFDKD
jgi:hypothetical protein